MNFLKKYWPTITAALGGVLPFLLPSLLAYVQAHPHTTIGVLLAAVIAAYHATAPKDQSSSSSLLKAIALIAALVFCLSVPSQAQTAAAPASSSPLTNIYAGGISFNNSGSPAIAGTGLYARLLSDGSGTYAFTAVDVLPNTVKPFTVTTNMSAGIAQKLFSIGSIPIFVPTSAGVSFQGSNTGWAWSSGGLAVISISKKKHLFLCPMLRVNKSSVSNGTGYQLIGGGLFAWGK